MRLLFLYPNIKSFFQPGLWLLLAVLLLGVSAGDEIELENYFNARYSANFIKKAKNIVTVLPPKTRARVSEVKEMPSGNLGMRVQVLNGKSTGESVWVYYNKNRPQMKLYSSENAEGVEVPADDSVKIKSVQTTAKTRGIKEPSLADQWVDENEVEKKSAENETTNVELEDVARKAVNINEVVQKAGLKSDRCVDCALRGSGTSLGRDITINDKKARIVAPLKASNTKKAVPVCLSKNGYDACTYPGDHAPTQFKINNSGPNRIVASRGFSTRREWTFASPDFASQDSGIYVEDYHGDNFENSVRSYVMLFPRKSLFNVRVEGEEKIVTLPTGETMIFNNRTNEVISGVFAERGLLGASKQSPLVNYSGQGIMVRANTQGVNEPKQAQTATISKQGKTCTVPASELWLQESSSQLNFKYSTDQEFHSYLQKKCGFGIWQQ